MIGTPTFAQRGQSQSIQTATLPAPIKGVDTRQVLSHMDEDICIYSFNLIPSAYGMTVRRGYREFATKIHVNKATHEGVRSLLVFSGTLSGTRLDDKLFAVTNQGIFDVTNPLQPPKLKLLFSITTESAGYGIDMRYTDEGGNEYMFFADERNGLFYYDGATDVWARYTGINNVPAEEIVFITVHKQRIWFVQRNTAIGWYLDVGAVAGDATAFYFGSVFKHGGDLKGLYNWSIDGGSGVDDQLVAISTTGDVLPFKGEDPSSADTWSLVGIYYIGETPTGRRITNEFGGSLYTLSSYGIISMADLLKGVDPKDVSANSIAYKIAPIISDELRDTAYMYGWELLFAPSEGLFIVNSPESKNGLQIQYVMDMVTEGWGFWRGVPIACMKEWDGRVYFGSGDTVFVLDGTRDNVKKYQNTEEDLGTPVEFSLLTSFQSVGSPGVYKQTQFIRPDFLGGTLPSFSVKAVYDYQMNEVELPVRQNELSKGRWDVGRWDEVLWSSSIIAGKHRLHGAGGLGRTMAVALKGSTTDRLQLVSFDVMWKSGGAV